MGQGEVKNTAVLGALARLIGFYVLIGAAIMALVRLVPAAADIIGTNLDVSVPAVGQFQSAFEQSAAPQLRPYAWLDAIAAMAGALLFALPVAWTYRTTKRGESYDRSLVQIIVMLPTVVAAVVMVVYDKIALAFALAGIVAAIRFRTTFKDVRDAVFAFAAIGIGLACGVRSWMLAGTLSAFFSVLALVLWRMEVSAGMGVAARRGGSPRLSEALVPDDDEPTVALGESQLIAPLTVDERRGLSERVDRLTQYVRADALEKSGKYRHLLLVHASDREAAEPVVEDVLEESTKRWRLVDTFPGRDGTTVLEYLVRLGKKADVADFLDRILDAGEDVVRAAELKSMKGMRDRLA